MLTTILTVRVRCLATLLFARDINKEHATWVGVHGSNLIPNILGGIEVFSLICVELFERLETVHIRLIPALQLLVELAAFDQILLVHITKLAVYRYQIA